MASVRVSLNLKGSKNIFSQETIAAGENRFALELNEKEVIELLEDLSYILGAFLIKQLFHSGLFGYEMIIANSALRASLAIYHLISNARLWNNC